MYREDLVLFLSELFPHLRGLRGFEVSHQILIHLLQTRFRFRDPLRGPGPRRALSCRLTPPVGRPRARSAPSMHETEKHTGHLLCFAQKRA